MRLHFRWLSIITLLGMASMVWAADATFHQNSNFSLENLGKIFTPGQNDVSMSFLRVLFGNLGPLTSSGSQMMGRVFAFYNYAVLILMGILLTYTSLMTTFNVAQGGLFLGGKLDSAWLALRSAMGVAFLLPNANGYCMMQVIFMTLLTWGVGGANQVWNAALDYLNRGGVIIAPLANNYTGDASNLSSLRGDPIAAGAASLIRTQVCIEGLQKALRQAESTSTTRRTFPNLNAATDFNLFSLQQTIVQSQSLSLPIYDGGNSERALPGALAGACGSLSWKWDIKAMGVPDINQLRDPAATPPIIVSLNQSYLTMMLPSLAQAIFYTQNIAQTIVNNQFLKTGKRDLGRCPTQGVCDAAHWGRCPNQTADCTSALPSLGPNCCLLTGGEVMDAAQLFTGLMLPLLNSFAQNRETSFIQNSKEYGWMMAGAYFYDLIKLNVTVSGGLEHFSFSASAPTLSDALLSNLADDYCSGSRDNAQCRSGFLNVGTLLKETDTYLNSAQNYLKTYQPGMGSGGIDHPANIPNIVMPVNRGNLNITNGGLIDPVSNAFLGVLYVYKEIKASISTSSGSFNPILALAMAGRQLIEGLFITWISLMIMFALMATLLAAIPEFNFAIIADLLSSFIIPLLTILFVAVMVPAMTLVYYIPLIPYLMFFFSSIGWLMAVMEAAVSAPLVAVGLAMPGSQHMVLGEARPALMLMVNSFLRPALMIIGYVAGIMMSYVSVWLLVMGFDHVWANVPTSGFTSLTANIAQIVIFTSATVQLMHRSFSLTYFLPDRVSRWVGGQTEHMGQEIEGEMHQLSHTSDKAGQMLGEASGQFSDMFAGQMVTGPRLKAIKDAIKARLQAAKVAAELSKGKGTIEGHDRPETVPATPEENASKGASSSAPDKAPKSKPKKGANRGNERDNERDDESDDEDEK